MELKRFLGDMAVAFEATGNPVAINVAAMIQRLDSGAEVNSAQQVTTPSSMKQALSAADCHPAADQLKFIADSFPWISAKGFRKAPETFMGNYNFVLIVGPNDIVINKEFRCGIFLQDANTFYPSHMHEAEELYFPLSGTALWQKNTGEFEPINSGQLIHHLPNQPHATWTRDAPMLAFWAWVGNLSADTYTYV
ncbi:MAG: hypothetical protein GY761_08765 [Hyphomicrobiales bacterium]|nr:hypothetical protein [Hyphomicrobiales bacterium]